jgi:acyl transferase domain-containing protein
MTEHEPHGGLATAPGRSVPVREPAAQPGGRTRPAECPDVVFVYSGDGSRYGGTGRGQLATEPAFADAIDDLDAIFQWEHGFSLRQVFSGRRAVDDVIVRQSVLFAVQVGLTALWRAHGIAPTAVLGQSTGEVAAAVAAGALRLTDAFRILAHRAELSTGNLTGNLTGLRPMPAKLPFYSTVLADPRERPDFDTGYWVANLRRPARLAKAVGAALTDGHTTFVEIAPHPVSAPTVTETATRTAAGTPVRILPSLRHDRDEQLTFLSSLGRLLAAGGGAPAEVGAA